MLDIVDKEPADPEVPRDVDRGGSVGLQQFGQLVGALAPAFVEAHGLMLLHPPAFQ